MKYLLVLLLIFMTLSSHWLCTHMYIWACAPSGFIGFLRTSIGLGSPMCGFLMQMQYQTAKYYSVLWIAVGISIINLIYSIIQPVVQPSVQQVSKIIQPQANYINTVKS